MNDIQSTFEVNESVFRKWPKKLSQSPSGRWPLGGNKRIWLLT